MGDPVTTAVLLGASGGLQAVGAISEGNAKKAAADYNARMALNNAAQTRVQAAEEERRSRIMARKQIGSMRAGYAKSGVTMEGSPLDVLEESASTAELDALTIRHGGEVKAQAFENEARLESWKGKQARTQGYLTAASSLLGTGAKMSGSGGGGAKT
jgi:hypothetical protein